MPVLRRVRPKGAALSACVKGWVIKARGGAGAAAWKGFRRSDCGSKWFDALVTAYGRRCVYCDHSPARTIDHVKPKAATPAAVFDWNNWLPACGECNRLKGTKVGLIRPHAEDPGEFIIFNVVTGAPDANTRGVPRKARKGVKTIKKLDLDHQVLNDARRTVRERAVEMFLKLGRGELTPGEVVNGLRSNPAHSAIIRELILEADGALNPYLGIVQQAVALIPQLAAWAARPLDHPL